MSEALYSFVDGLYGHVDSTADATDATDVVGPADSTDVTDAMERSEQRDGKKSGAGSGATTAAASDASASQELAESDVELVQGPMKWCRPVGKSGRWQFFTEMAFVLLLFPAVILGQMWLGVRYTLALSILIILCGVVLFLFLFDTRKPHARELVVIASLIALGVAGRSVFFMLPQFKPVAALVIISGVSLGRETGFIVGSMTMLVSNIFFGQGPWTPWQMLAFGIIGFVAGGLHRAHILPAYRWTLCLFGFFSIFFIYGLIMNPASLLMYSAQITPMSLLAVYVSGAPMDLVHAISTVCFLFVLARPFLEKLERLKVKYDLR